LFDGLDINSVLKALTFLLAMVVSLSFHEFAHAWTAKHFGDDTAEKEGRLTLNPLPHLDPWGSVIIPFFGFLLVGGLIGWAKPVPVQISNLKNPKRDYVLVALAGPFSNILACLFFSVVFVFIGKMGMFPEETSFFFPLINLVLAGILVNAILAIFNLIPLPPLDGATLLERFLPIKWEQKYTKYIVPNGFMILLMLIFAGLGNWIIVGAQIIQSICLAVPTLIVGLLN